ncbi:MAG: hypothetical protein ACNS62_23120 [Candidatus Cyclobacteriaceae bacterium M3_2C_046]
MKSAIAILLLLHLTFQSAHSQLYIGASYDLGNQLQFSPENKDLLRSPMASSGSLTFFVQEDVVEHWYLQYGLTAGVIGTIFKHNLDTDTLYQSGYPNSFVSLAEYGNLYAEGYLSIGRNIRLAKVPLVIHLGAGIFFVDDYSSSSSSWVFYNEDQYKLLEYDIGRISSKPRGFVVISLQKKIKEWALLSLRYKHYFQSSLSGNFAFYHLVQAYQGTLFLESRLISLTFAAKIKK